MSTTTAGTTTGDGLRVQLLGPVRAWSGETELALGPARQRAVFAALAGRANQLVSRQELIDAVWGTSPPRNVVGSLHTYVSGLRRALGPHRTDLVSRASGYCLRLAENAVDTEVFDRTRAEGGRLLAAGQWSQARDALGRALALWHGAACSGVPGPFAELERHRLAELRLGAAELHACARLELGEHAEVVADLAGLIAEHPWHESLRELVMLALHRSGRRAEALEAFQEARRALISQQGVEPGPALRELHQQILAGPATPPPAAPPRLHSVPAPVAQALRQPNTTFVGRVEETALLRDLVADVLAGRGAAVWIEGEAGIGKSELLRAALADAADRGCQLAWATADELGGRFPLQVVMDCLDVHPSSPDRRRAELAARLRAEPAHGRWGPSDPVPTAVDQLMGLVDQACATAPLLLVVDDLHWADDASVLLWHRLANATRQLPLLLVAATRPDLGRPELTQVRRGVEARNGHVLELRPLAQTEAEELIGHVVGAPPGEALRELARRTAGNPLYTKEVAHALVRGNSVRVVRGVAHVDLTAALEVPRSLLAAVDRTVESLSHPTREVLRFAALLGAEFRVAELTAVTGRSPLELAGVLSEAVAATVVVEAGDDLAFRHPYLRQALHEAIPLPVRAALHRHAAEALAGVGVPVERVAEHLVADPIPVDDWVVGWLVEHHVAVTNRAPAIATDLLRRTLATDLPTPAQRATLLVALVKVLFRLERFPEREAEQALRLITDPADAAEMRHLRAAMRHRLGDTDTAIAMLREALEAPDVPAIWRTRHRSLLANFRRGDLADLDLAERTARRAHAEAVAEGEPYPIAQASQTLWLIHSIRRDHERALRHVDDALRVTGHHPGLAELRFDLLDNRVFSLQNLDRLAEAEQALRSADAVADQQHLPTALQVSAAVHHYWTGQWDQALAELDTVTEDGPAITFFGLREPGPAALLMHGVAALIAGRRHDRVTAAAHLEAAEAHAPSTGAERESCDFYLVATALAAERRGATAEALDHLAPVLRPDYARMMLRHQWLPYATRLALDVGDHTAAREALAVCQEEADKEVRPARAFAAAEHCRGLVAGDPEPVLTAASHYRRVGRVVELASALEDAAVLLAAHDRADEASATFAEAVELFGAVHARWDVHRAESRRRAAGVRREREPDASGLPALSPLEVRIARLVAAGLSNPDIAQELAMPRRTVQSHVSRLLDKLDSRSRADIAEHVNPAC
ncbi:BTAD domain-containing putative transcriptional regulator [Saccharothrix coeruleofusca]|uniref:SARP family transcriptional regulator n=1 Tax=Saccharothrix coeruleofusca TaxID=33919 RepID=A0A918AVH3_9PSEU|nr:BTAD domain-containing putative transcriptional regulator [Saccharothrix coeruleofusca]GGP76449.1 SARP family transcriptional regulator [Saccharothrix coeruleofusca]